MATSLAELIAAVNLDSVPLDAATEEAEDTVASYGDDDTDWAAADDLAVAETDEAPAEIDEAPPETAVASAEADEAPADAPAVDVQVFTKPAYVALPAIWNEGDGSDTGSTGDEYVDWWCGIDPVELYFDLIDVAIDVPADGGVAICIKPWVGDDGSIGGEIVDDTVLVDDSGAGDEYVDWWCGIAPDDLYTGEPVDEAVDTGDEGVLADEGFIDNGFMDVETGMAIRMMPPEYLEDWVLVDDTPAGDGTGEEAVFDDGLIFIDDGFIFVDDGVIDEGFVDEGYIDESYVDGSTGDESIVDESAGEEVFVKDGGGGEEIVEVFYPMDPIDWATICICYPADMMIA